jgi:hypothetical protein
MPPTTERAAMRARVRLVGVAVTLALVACGSRAGDTDGGTDAGDERPSLAIPPVDGPYDWTIDPADFVDTVDNPYFPLTPGARLVYEGHSEGEREVVTIEVLSETKEILGVTCVVVKDAVEAAGELKELTFDWYAQDADGNVWYFGETTEEYEGGKVVTRAGSWEAGVDGALPGVIMPADPEVGLAYTQEHYPGEAEDKGKVIAVGGSITVPFGSFEDVVVTRDWTPLEPGVREQKTYAPGIGVVFEEVVRGDAGVLRLVEATGI